MVYHGLPLSIQAVSYCVPLIVCVMLKMVTETWQGRAIHKLTTVVFQAAIYNPNNMYMYIKKPNLYTINQTCKYDHAQQPYIPIYRHNNPNS